MEQKMLNYIFSPLTYFMVSLWSHNYLLFRFVPLTLLLLVILVLSISFQPQTLETKRKRERTWKLSDVVSIL